MFEAVYNFIALLSVYIYGPLALLAIAVSVFRRARGLAGSTLYFCTWVWGAQVWMMSVISVVHAWGVFWMLVGVVLGGLGVVPMAFLCFLFRGEWLKLGHLLVWISVIVAARALALTMQQSRQRQNSELESRFPPATPKTEDHYI